MSTYVDGFVLPISRDKLDEYRELAEVAAIVWKEHGALAYRECLADDMDAPGMLPFPQLANVQEDEVVIFAWIAFESREHRDDVNAKVMADPRLKGLMDPANMPFDCSRMAYGGFRTIVQA